MLPTLLEAQPHQFGQQGVWFLISSACPLQLQSPVTNLRMLQPLCCTPAKQRPDDIIKHHLSFQKQEGDQHLGTDSLSFELIPHCVFIASLTTFFLLSDMLYSKGSQKRQRPCLAISLQPKLPATSGSFRALGICCKQKELWASTPAPHVDLPAGITAPSPEPPYN